MPPRTSASRTKAMPCRDCGDPVTVGSRTRKPPRCLSCGIRAHVDQVTQMRNRSGPYWDAWQEAVARRRAYESRGTPLNKDTLIPTGQDVLLASRGATL